MPYLPTSQSYLEQSSFLLQAYPDTRIMTKYTFPPTQSRPKNRISKPTDTATTTTTTPIATLTLKTFNPTAGICLKYRTNKAAEVGRLMLSLGKLAAGADVEGLRLGSAAAAATTATTGGDLEMVDVSSKGAEESGNVAGGATGGKGGKAKKKGGKGKK